jgi:hypothetical protein
MSETTPQIVITRLSSGYVHVRGRGPCNWVQPKHWPCSEEVLRAAAFPEASEDFLQAVLRLAESYERR